MSTTSTLPWPASILRTMRQDAPGSSRASGSSPSPLHSSSAAFQDPGTEMDDERLLERFTTACELVGGAVHHLDDVGEVAAFIATLARGGADVASILSWAPEHLPLPGVLEACASRGVAALDASVRPDADGRHEDLARLDAASVGVTGAIALLADTGSVLVASGPGRPRLASLLPPVHVALVTRSQLVPSLGAWAARNGGAPAACANLVVITGPSRTADIEMTLTRGVHGPRAVHVVFVA
jgi:L-lactate dehydrogenase complex protein LldG